MSLYGLTVAQHLHALYREGFKECFGLFCLVLFCLVGIRMNSRVLSEWPLPSPRDIFVPFDVQWAECFLFFLFVHIFAFAVSLFHHF